MKKLLAFILVGAMLLTTLCLPLSAAADAWDGTADTSWYNTTDSVFILTTAEQLAGLASLVNGGNRFSDKEIVLDADIDLNNLGWTPIGVVGGTGFSGTFDGQGHTISNLKNVGYNGNYADWNDTASYLGFFGNLEKATVKNVGIVNANIAHGAGSSDGALAAVAYASDIVNCYVKGGSVSAWHTVGGLVGEMKSDNGGTSSVIGCYVIDVTVTAGSGLDIHAGGLICNMTGAGNVRNCYSATNLERLFSGADKTAGAGVSGCYYKAASEGGTDKFGAVAKTEAQMKDAAFVDAVNTGISGDMKFAAVSGSYPELVFKPVTSSTWDGKVVTSWYNDTDKVFTLTNARQLAGLAKLVNEGKTMEGKTIVLGVDVDLNNLGWTPIGAEAHQFLGTFDGQGHTISNLKNVGYNSNYNDWSNTANYLGFFGYISKATVKNVGIVNANIACGAGNNYGALAGFAYASEIENCCVIGGSVIGWHTVGGLIGEIKSDNGGTTSVIRCFVTGVTVTAGTGLDIHAGGLICNMNGAAWVKNCYSVTNLERMFSGAEKTVGAGVLNCYYQAASEGGTDNFGAVAKTEAQLKDEKFVYELNKGIEGEVRYSAASNSYPALNLRVDPLAPTASISVNDNVSLNIYSEIDYIAEKNGIDAELATIEANIGGYPLTLGKAVDFVNAGNKISVMTSPSQINDKITVKLEGVDGEGKTVSVTIVEDYSVYTYCDYIIKNYSDEKVVNVCKALVNYGRVAQEVFNDGIEGTDISAEVYDLDLDPIIVTPTPFATDIETYDPEMISFLALDKSGVRFYYNPSLGENVSIKVDETRLTTEDNIGSGVVNGYSETGTKFANALKYVQVEKIDAVDLNTRFTVTVNNDQSFDYSALQCVYDLATINSDYWNFYNALDQYYQAAVACFVQE